MDDAHSSSGKLSPRSPRQRRPRQRSISSLHGMLLSDDDDTQKDPRSASGGIIFRQTEMTQDADARDRLAALCTPPRGPRSKSISSLEGFMLTPSTNPETPSTDSTSLDVSNPNLQLPVLRGSPASPSAVRHLIVDRADGSSMIHETVSSEGTKQATYTRRPTTATTSHSLVTPLKNSDWHENTPKASSPNPSDKFKNRTQSTPTVKLGSDNKKRVFGNFRFGQKSQKSAPGA